MSCELCEGAFARTSGRVNCVVSDALALRIVDGVVCDFFRVDSRRAVVV